MLHSLGTLMKRLAGARNRRAGQIPEACSQRHWHGSLPPTSHPTTVDQSLDEFLGRVEPEVATIFPADIKTSEELDFEASKLILLFNKSNYEVQMCLELT